MVIYSYTWRKKGFFREVPELLKPRILAEGFYLHASDEGKQVYIKSEWAFKRKWYLGGPPDEQIVNSMLLRVGYVLSPSMTEIVFTWENPYHCPYHIRDWAWKNTTTFFHYLEEWFKTAGELEVSDEGT